jgi:hypothetical protein
MSKEYLNNRAFENIIATFQKSKRLKIRYDLIIGDINDRIKRKRKRKKISDTDKNLLKLNQVKMFEIIEEFEEAEKLLAAAFYTLSENIVRYAKFNLIDQDDAIQEGVVICFEKIDRFNPSKGKAFNYMTTCILNHFRQLYRTARNYNELKKRYHNFLQQQLNSVIMRNGKEVSAYRSCLDSGTQETF